MNEKHFIAIAGLAFGGLLVLVAVAVVGLLLFQFPFSSGDVPSPAPTLKRDARQETVPSTLATPEVASAAHLLQPTPMPQEDSLIGLYDQVNPGVVSIQVYLSRGGFPDSVAGSGFILDEDGHIVTNNHVISRADLIAVIFYEGTEIQAEVVGTDADSDLAVIQVNELPANVRSLPLGDSSQVEPGQKVIAIGNPFRLGGTMTSGVVSAIGRTIPAGMTPFQIPEAIQTDAAINPGNSGGPLLNLQGEVIGVNAQIATGNQSQVNAGVGFAIPSSVVRKVTPALIEAGFYDWAWLGVEGGGVNLLIAEANDLETQEGAYIDVVRSNGPAEEAGLRGSTGTTDVADLPIRTGGDVVIEAGGEPVANFSDLLMAIADRRPGDELALTILRDGERQQVTITLESRP